MIASVMAAFKIPDLKKRIYFLFMMMVVYVIGLHISVPGVDSLVLREKLNSGLFDLFDAFTGGAFKKYTIFAMGIMPYINASIIMQLLTMAWPKLKELQQEGESGQKKIRLWTRWATVGFAFLQSVSVTSLLKANGAVELGSAINLGLFKIDLMIIQISIILVAGTMFLMWLGEQITEKGIGNGVSMIIFIGIVSRLPFDMVVTYNVVKTNNQWISGFLLILTFVATVAFMIAVTQAQRKIPIQHVKRVVGNKVYGGQSSYLPLKVNSAGVIPIIFAVSLQYLPMTLANIISSGNTQTTFYKFAQGFSPGGSWWGSAIYALFIIGFTYFYTAVSFDVKDVSDNLKKWGSYIPGIRPGKPTQDYLDKVLTRITLAGAIFLAIVALLQYYVPRMLNINTFSLVGGTSMLIVVGVALDTMQAIESHLMMRHYEGFIK